MRVRTFGHGTATAGETTDLLRAAGIDSIVDVRSAPGSRHNPHMARGELARWLPERGIGYRWDRRLGGFRKLPADSPDTVWRNDSFRAYAAHTRSEEFRAGIEDVLADARSRGVAVMCSEAVWWRCHRRLIADFLCLVRGVSVSHLMDDGRENAHLPLPGARVRQDGLLVYDDDRAAAS